MGWICALRKMSPLWSLQIKETSEEEVLNLQSMPSPPPLLQSLGLHGRLEKWPEWIPKLKSIASISLKRSNLMEDPLKVLQALPNLMSLKLHDGYRGDQLHIEGGGFQKLNYLGLLHLERLNRLIIDEGALPLLEKLEIGDCPQLKEVLSGIHHMNCQLNSFLVCNQMKALILGKSSIFPLSLSVVGLMDKTAIGTRLVIQNC
ncbi:hypothetical protein SO802_014249 [Lithocarpus litseifolius]|uniref:Disease resistance R13L4/SHOC-2-like LRR domain-containing protein n=1 Tax=Lithocarpus litseifolius TaxID=425828 RepID=A0AAW2CQG1_9ROSI